MKIQHACTYACTYICIYAHLCVFMLTTHFLFRLFNCIFLFSVCYFFPSTLSNIQIQIFVYYKHLLPFAFAFLRFIQTVRYDFTHVRQCVCAMGDGLREQWLVHGVSAIRVCLLYLHLYFVCRRCVCVRKGWVTLVSLQAS